MDEGLDREYIEHLAATLPAGLTGCVSWSTPRTARPVILAPALFERLGAVVDCIGCAPDGRNINLNCGSLHLEGLRERVLADRAPIWAWRSMATRTARCSSRIRARSSTATR